MFLVLSIYNEKIFIIDLPERELRNVIGQSLFLSVIKLILVNKMQNRYSVIFFEQRNYFCVKYVLAIYIVTVLGKLQSKL